MYLFLAFLVFSHERVDKAFPVFTNVDGDRVSSEDIPLTSPLFVEFDVFNRRFKVELRDSSYRAGRTLLKQSLCDFSTRLVGDPESYGSVSLCNSIQGSFVSSGSEYRMRSTENGEIEVEMLEHDVGGQPGEEDMHKDVSGRKVLRLFVINDFERVQEVGPGINVDTIEIFNNAKNIFEKSRWRRHNIELVLSGILNVVDRPLIYEPFNEFQRLNRLRFDGSPEPQGDEQARSIERLKRLSEAVASVRNDLGDTYVHLGRSNLVFLLQASDTGRVNGVSFIGGAGSSLEGVGIVKILDADSYFYKGKILAHEISHSLGALHGPGTGHLMKEEEGPADREENTVLGETAIREIEDFIDRNKLDLGPVSTCGNGIMDGTKECDSGLPLGSVCCTRECKLRPRAQCDDRNGRCCRGCNLVPTGTTCRDRSPNVYKTDCEHRSYCDGVSATCSIKYVEDGTRPQSGGVCMKGVVQTEALMCQRIGRFFSPKCSSPDGTLWCLDEYGVCTPMLTSLHTPIILPKAVLYSIEGISSVSGIEDRPADRGPDILAPLAALSLCVVALLFLAF